MKICEVIWIFTNYLWKTGSWKRDVSFFAEFRSTVMRAMLVSSLVADLAVGVEIKTMLSLFTHPYPLSDCRNHYEEQCSLLGRWNGLWPVTQREGKSFICLLLHVCSIHLIQPSLPQQGPLEFDIQMQCIENDHQSASSIIQGFGIAEGRPKEDLKNMANRAGQSCRDYTPPGGKTLEQVRLGSERFQLSLWPGCWLATAKN